MQSCHSTASTQLADAEFGRILESISSQYAELLPAFHDVLREGGTRLELFEAGIEDSLAAYQETDGAVATRFDQNGPDGSTGATGFADSHDISLHCPTVTTDLPMVSFGGLFDRVCDLIVWVGFRDPREYVTQWIAGDVGKAYTHGEVWDMLAVAIGGVSGNLGTGAAGIPAAWTGETADRIADRLRDWVALLSEHSGSASTMGSHVRDMADQAVAMAQTVVIIIKPVISLVSAALSNAYIPGYGQWKAIQAVKDAWKLVNNARKVITTFWNALKMIISTIQMTVQAFQITALPPAPQASP